MISPGKSALRLESHDQAGVEDGWRNGRLSVVIRMGLRRISMSASPINLLI
jgi:hypothetical protein